MPDRIEAGTFMVAGAISQGEIMITNCNFSHLDALVGTLKKAGVKIVPEDTGVRVKGCEEIRSVDIETSPYPGFPTDMQAQIMALMTVANGVSVINETVFENRFMHASELRRLGANILVDGHKATVKGVSKLEGATLMATDLRASASLILAGLRAEGLTEISRVYHLDRGYEDIEGKLSNLGAEIKRVKE
jgi:UDP-N-acetylglucosamine 1-carboxyvinyltransferase